MAKSVLFAIIALPVLTSTHGSSKADPNLMSVEKIRRAVYPVSGGYAYHVIGIAQHALPHYPLGWPFHLGPELTKLPVVGASYDEVEYTSSRSSQSESPESADVNDSKNVTTNEFFNYSYPNLQHQLSYVKIQYYLNQLKKNAENIESIIQENRKKRAINTTSYQKYVAGTIQHPSLNNLRKETSKRGRSVSSTNQNSEAKSAKLNRNNEDVLRNNIYESFVKPF